MNWFRSLAIVLCATMSSFSQLTTIDGLRTTFTAADGKTSDTKVTPTIALYVPRGESPTQFLPGGKFTATWTGFLRADLRDDVSFQAEVNGTLKLEIAGTNVFDAADTKGPSPFSKPVRVKKGLNVIRATYTSPMTSDAMVRLAMKTSDGLVQTLDPQRLSCTDSAELNRADATRTGLSLFLEHRCAHCHDTGISNGIPDLNMDAPSLENIGSRLREGWMARWIANPKAIRPDAHMPQLRVASSAETAQAIAAYLASTGTNKSVEVKLTSDESSKARAIFETQHCDACHFTEGVGAPDAKKLSLAEVASKYYPDALASFIGNPIAHYQWTGMPRFKLSRADCELLANWLVSRSRAFAQTPSAATPETIQRGKQLVQTAGCLQCHALKLENKFSTMPLAQLTVAHGGCLTGQQSVDFNFNIMERGAIELWLSTDRAALKRNVPTEFVDRHFARLHCAECHSKLENVPPLNNIGEKIKPDWAAKFIGGQIAQKPRTWLPSQMPAFPSYAAEMAQGLSERKGFAPHSTFEKPDADLARIGSELVQAPPKGLGCVQCHANGVMMPTTSDAPGINFAFVAERLQPQYFQRWVKKPQAIDPHTKMPAFFSDEGTSPLKQYLDGNADKQIAAIWEYLQTLRQ
jgi:mono/diheme cytochrome c family protein